MALAKDIVGLLQGFAVLATAIVALIGVNKWRSELVGKKRIELAEEVLALFYEARDKIRLIRHPFSSVGEGTSRQAADWEPAAVEQVLNMAYVLRERYKIEESFFSQLRAKRYRFMAFFGQEGGKPFDELDAVIATLLAATTRIGDLWLRQGREKMSEENFNRHLSDKHRVEAIFWDGFADPDPINPRMDGIIQNIERICARQLGEP